MAETKIPAKAYLPLPDEGDPIEEALRKILGGEGGGEGPPGEGPEVTTLPPGEEPGKWYTAPSGQTYRWIVSRRQTQFDPRTAAPSVVTYYKTQVGGKAPPDLEAVERRVQARNLTTISAQPFTDAEGNTWKQVPRGKDSETGVPLYGWEKAPRPKAKVKPPAGPDPRLLDVNKKPDIISPLGDWDWVNNAYEVSVTDEEGNMVGTRAVAGWFPTETAQPRFTRQRVEDEIWTYDEKGTLVGKDPVPMSRAEMDALAKASRAEQRQYFQDIEAKKTQEAEAAQKAEESRLNREMLAEETRVGAMGKYVERGASFADILRAFGPGITRRQEFPWSKEQVGTLPVRSPFRDLAPEAQGRMRPEDIAAYRPSRPAFLGTPPPSAITGVPGIGQPILPQYLTPEAIEAIKAQMREAGASESDIANYLTQSAEQEYPWVTREHEGLSPEEYTKAGVPWAYRQPPGRPLGLGWAVTPGTFVGAVGGFNPYTEQGRVEMEEWNRERQANAAREYAASVERIERMSPGLKEYLPTSSALLTEPSEEELAIAQRKRLTQMSMPGWMTRETRRKPFYQR